MIQCADCEFFVRGPGDQVAFKCDPFVNIKEPECLIKWQLLKATETTQKMDRLVAAYEATLAIYQKIQPMQEKMFRHMEQEIDDVQDSDSWKYGGAEDGDETDLDNDAPGR